MKRKRYWAVCYGHVCRWSQLAENATAACKYTFGCVIPDKMTVREFPSNPKYIALYKRNAFLEELFKRHQEKTGEVIK